MMWLRVLFLRAMIAAARFELAFSPDRNPANLRELRADITRMEARLDRLVVLGHE